MRQEERVPRGKQPRAFRTSQKRDMDLRKDPAEEFDEQKIGYNQRILEKPPNRLYGSPPNKDAFIAANSLMSGNGQEKKPEVIYVH